MAVDRETVRVIRHVVLFKFHPETTEAQIDAYERDLIDYVATLDGVISYRLGRDAGINPGTFDFSIVAEFDDLDAFRRYFDGARHKEIQAATASMVIDKSSSQSVFDLG